VGLTPLQSRNHSWLQKISKCLGTVTTYFERLKTESPSEVRMCVLWISLDHDVEVRDCLFV